MQTKLLLTLASGLIVFSLSTQADVKIVQSKDGKIVEVATDAAEATCGKNFIFREAKKEEAPAYLAKEIIKAAFKGEMSPSIDALVSSLKTSNGKCAWVTPDELPKTK